MGNLSGVLALFSILLRPALVVPHVQVADIRSLDWAALHANGVRFLVFDKDNCLTRPHQDRLEPVLQEAWAEAHRIFGRENVLIVSNSAGSSDDPSALGAEALSRALMGSPVLCHAKKKPAKSCARETLDYFVALTTQREEVLAISRRMPPGSAVINQPRRTKGKLPPVEKDGHGTILVVGDRTMTDAVLAHRTGDEIERRKGQPQCVSVLTTGLWTNEGRINMWMRAFENKLTARLIQRGLQPGQKGWSPSQTLAQDWQSIAVKPPAAKIPQVDSALTKDPVPGSVSPALGSILFTTLIRPLPPRIASSARWVAGTRPVSWLSSTVSDGWGVVIKGMQEGVRPPSPFLEGRRRPQRIGRRLYSTMPPRPSRVPMKNWIAALTALVLIPTGYFGGVYIHEALDQRQASRDLPPPPTPQQLQRTAHSDLLERRQSLELARWHLHNEQTEINDKLTRVRSRLEC